MIPTLLGAGVLTFFLMRVVPGDICLARWVDYGTDLDPALLELCRDRLGLNEPLHIQFLHFMRGVLSFDFGVSMWTGRPIIEELDPRFALSLQLAVMATVVTLLIAVPLGIRGLEAKYLGRLSGAHRRHCGSSDAILLARHLDYPGIFDFFRGMVRRTVDAPDLLCFSI